MLIWQEDGSTRMFMDELSLPNHVHLQYIWVKYLCNIFRSDCDYHHHIRLQVDRDAVFESAMQRLGRFNGSKLRNSQLDVTFKNEAGTLFSWGWWFHELHRKPNIKKLL